MEILLNIDDIRTMATISSLAAEKMINANSLMSGIVSKHDWKCPERTDIDNTIERLKGNSATINEAFMSFSNNLISIANSYTDYTNIRDREDATYTNDTMSRLSEFSAGGKPTIVTNGSNTHGVVSELEAASNDFSNIASLHGATHGITIIDFKLMNP